ncbi:hypothetical protein PRZ48_008745 [Zasmidium cellare]|uniref:Uncharacterized protein n=1 Tax=Zasmidium cellare TaxID=395010 RepID=A0ABR0EH46_ZASCE|nr:hypothetical protein PRZ48_008745 [Zasmidium cellare]
MSDNTTVARAAVLTDIPGVDLPYFFCDTCLARKWFDCDWRRRAENEHLGQGHPNFNPRLILPCSNCRFHGGKNCACSASPYTMRQSLQAMIDHPPHVVEEPREREDLPMKKKSIRPGWEGLSNSTAPGLPQDILQDPVRALQTPARVPNPAPASEAVLNQQLQALSVSGPSLSQVQMPPTYPTPAPPQIAPAPSQPAPAEEPPTFTFSLPVRGKQSESSPSQQGRQE